MRRTAAPASALALIVSLVPAVAVFLAPSARPARAEIEKQAPPKPEKPEVPAKPEAPEQLEQPEQPEQPPADDPPGAGEPGGLGPADRGLDDPEVERLTLRLADWEKSAAKVEVEGLAARAFLAPDALAYRAASAFIALRRGGVARDAAIARVRESLDRWKRYDGASLLVVGLENRRFAPSDDSRRVFTLTKNLARESVVVHIGSKGRASTALAGMPLNLPLSTLQIQRFWTTSDGATRRVSPRPRDELVRDPASIGRVPKLSKPFRALVLERDPAEVEILVRRAQLERSRQGAFRVELREWKRYEGPWDRKVLDLNENREWKDIDGVALDVRLPPAGWEVHPDLEALVESVRASADDAAADPR